MVAILTEYYCDRDIIMNKKEGFLRHKFEIKYNIFLFPALPTQRFAGYCRDGSGGEVFIKGLHSSSANECHQQCRETGGCVAFAYSLGLYTYCYLYGGGPYTYGNKEPDATCYIMEGNPP